MGKFDKAKGAQGIKDVAVASNTQARTTKVIYINADKIIPNPENDEEVSYTTDLEISIEKFGFTQPIEVIERADETYMIISGHRRFEAGKKMKLTSFPCIVRDIKEDDIEEYLLYGNAQRNEEQDPMLFVRRVRKTKNMLEKKGVKGALREEIAKRYGFSTANVDRYLQANELIAPIIELYRQGKVGLSSCTDTGLYKHSKEEQAEIFAIMNECLESGETLKRDNVKRIVQQYREGKRSWLEVIQIEMDNGFLNPPTYNGAGVSVMSVNTEPGETKEQSDSPLSRNDEINYDYSHREGLPGGTEPYAEERLTADDLEAIEKASQNEEKEKEPKPKLTDEEKKAQAGEKIMKHLSDLEGLLNNFYSFQDNELFLKTMGSALVLMVQEMDSLAQEEDLGEVLKKQLDKVVEVINSLE